MRVHFERSGGFAGIRLTGTLVSEALSAEEQRKLSELIESAGFFELPEEIRTPNPGADRFEYKVTVEAGQRTHSIRVDEAAAPETLRPLLKWLTAAARKP